MRKGGILEQLTLHKGGARVHSAGQGTSRGQDYLCSLSTTRCTATHLAPSRDSILRAGESNTGHVLHGIGSVEARRIHQGRGDQHRDGVALLLMSKKLHRLLEGIAA
jgi:hypothetical protein